MRVLTCTVSVWNRNCWHSHCGCTTAPAVAVGLPAVPPASAPVPVLPCPAASVAGSPFAEGKHCMCTHREAHLCASFSSDCLCSAASTHVFWGRRTVCQLAGDKHAGTGDALESWYPVPSELSHLEIHFSRDQQRYELHFGQLTLSRDDRGDARSGAARKCWWFLSVLKWTLSDEMGQIFENPSRSGWGITGGHLLVYT